MSLLFSFHFFLAFHCLFLSRRAIATECLPSCKGKVAAWLLALTLPSLNPLPHCLTTFAALVMLLKRLLEGGRAPP